jgi:c-di-GMP-specific phosphodiesterase
MSNDRWIWDATATLEALGGAAVALWLWEPQVDRMSFTGPTRALGLGPLAPDCSGAALRALIQPQDRSAAAELLGVQPPGAEIEIRLRVLGGEQCLWRGVWLEDGVRAAGMVTAESRLSVSGFDSLTGLLDRRTFVARAQEQLMTSGDHILVVADLDRFRRLNEALGHERADLVLAALGARLAAAFPSEALAARVGEDEFAVLTPRSHPGPEEILRRALEQPLRISGLDIHPTLSLGAVEAGEGDTPDAAEMLRRAELAVETAKTEGRGAAVAYGRTLESDGLSRLALEGDLRGAIARGELRPYYQPIVNLTTGALSGFEALVRWNHPRRGLLTPDIFLRVCEEMGLVGELGAYMQCDAAVQLARWRRDHWASGDLTVSVNLSIGEIYREGLVNDIVRIRRETGLPPGALKLEVTENDVMRDPDAAAVILADLKGAGAGLALDDFGTGFSSLSYLARLPFDTLKIDRYFVRTMATNEGSAKIVSSVIKLGRDLALEVVAEGVENAQIARRLRALGCSYGQGFGYAPALSPQEAEVYLNECYVDGAAPLKPRG